MLDEIRSGQCSVEISIQYLKKEQFTSTAHIKSNPPKNSSILLRRRLVVPMFGIYNDGIFNLSLLFSRLQSPGTPHPKNGRGANKLDTDALRGQKPHMLREASRGDIERAWLNKMSHRSFRKNITVVPVSSEKNIAELRDDDEQLAGNFHRRDLATLEDCRELHSFLT